MTSPCPKCHGSGRRIKSVNFALECYFKYKTCPDCRGTGVLEVDTENETTRSMRQRLETWRECTPDAYSDPEAYYNPKPEKSDFDE